jgi:hypothetical protein
MLAIYLRPLLIAIPVAAALLLKLYAPGNTWFELILAGSFVAGSYLALALFTCLDPWHREILFGRIGKEWAKGRGKRNRRLEFDLQPPGFATPNW